jgi:hypothetical protein
MKTTDLDPALFRPYPELVEREIHETPYSIRDSEREPGLASRGAVDQKRRRMWVPLHEDGRSVGRHELGHTRFSPVTLPRVAFEPGVLAAVEDARVNLALQRSGVPSDLDFESEAYVVLLAARDARRGDAFALFQRAVASIGTSVAPALVAFLLRDEAPCGEAILRWMRRVQTALDAAAVRRDRVEAPFETALSLARSLARELRAHGVLDATGRARTRSVIQCCVEHPDGERSSGARRARGRTGEGEEARDGVEAGRLTIRTVPLRVALRARGGARTWRAGTEGSAVRYLHRWATDRAIFRCRTRARGGSVLIDASGSMSIGSEDLDRFLLVAPIGTRVAIYAGEGEAGELCVVAAGGQRAAVEDIACSGRGNIIDLPALEWLARQRGPRVWVSDGGVTGIGDKPSAALTARCAALRSRSGIRRVASLDDARKLFRAG